MEKDIRTLFAEGKLLIGKETTIKSLRKGMLQKIYISSNCQKALEAQTLTLSKVEHVPCEKLELTSSEIGIMCKRPFGIQVLGLKK